MEDCLGSSPRRFPPGEVDRLGCQQDDEASEEYPSGFYVFSYIMSAVLGHFSVIRRCISISSQGDVAASEGERKKFEEQRSRSILLA